jgi:polyhydroxyalkanoate synthesis regulator phasin
LIKNTEAKREEFEGQIKKAIEDAIGRVKVVSQKDFEDLVSRVEALEGTEGEGKKKATPKKKEVVVEA